MVSQIPYTFAPVPYALIRRYRGNALALEFICWTFTLVKTKEWKCSTKYGEVTLSPFEFTISLSDIESTLNITKIQSRRILKLFEKDGTLSKVTPKMTPRITVYRWVTERFSKLRDTQNDTQPGILPVRKIAPHTLLATEENIDKRKAQKKREELQSPASSNDSSAARSFFDIMLREGFRLDLKFLEEAIGRHGRPYVQRHLIKMLQDRDLGIKIKNPSGWIKTALKQNYCAENGGMAKMQPPTKES